VTLNLTNRKFSGYAWGGDVVGWISFNPISTVTVNPPIPPVTITGGGGSTITGTCTIPSTATIAQGTSTAEVMLSVSGLSGGTPEYSYPQFLYLPAGQYFNTSLIVTDSTGATGSLNCGGITVSVADPAGPLLWFKDEQPNDGNYNGLKKTVKEGRDVTVQYFRDGKICRGDFITKPDAYNTAVSGGSTDSWIRTDIIGTDEDFVFKKVVKGNYKMILVCEPPIAKRNTSWIANVINSLSSLFAQSEPPPVLSNPVEIIVTKNSIGEI
jgi:hypothetical protein